MSTTQESADDGSEGSATHNFRESVERAAPVTTDMWPRELKAINESLYIARNNIDDMHPAEREHHTFGQEEIREIEQNLRQKVADAKEDCEAGDDRWGEITLTAREITAVEDGLVVAQSEDNHTFSDRLARLSNLLTYETSPHTDT